jgi:4-cresol dehydrogenase (hydroxylating)
MSQLEAALNEWTCLLGKENVFCDSELIKKYARTTLACEISSLAILSPKSLSEVQEIVIIASRHKIPLYPISLGKNWGYGDKAPVSSGQVILDLSQLNKIHKVDKELAYAVVEPGVSQMQLYQYLLNNKIPLWMDVSGAGPDTSILGNVMERGFGHTPYGDHFLYSCGYEVVLADGSILKTGFGHYPSSKVSEVFKSAIGPSLDGLFTQSNFGIVTKIVVWLFPKPDYFKCFAIQIEDENKLLQVIDEMRQLRLNNVVQSHVHFGNDLRLLSSRMTFPYHLMANGNCLPNDLRLKLRNENGLSAWNAIGALYGNKAAVNANCKEVIRRISKFAKVRVFDDKRVALLNKLISIFDKTSFLSAYRAKLASLNIAYGLLQGIPLHQSLTGSLWQTKHQVNHNKSIDPLDYQAGFMWISPIIPMTSEHVNNALNIIQSIFQECGFDPFITMTSVTPRALCAVCTIYFDKANESESRRASDCYDKLFAAVMNEGYIPYRVGIQSMKKLKNDSPSSLTYWDTVHKLKEAIDPFGIISPQRYDPTTGD